MSRYKLDDTTIAILKNFANINPEIKFYAGTEQRTANLAKNMIADAVLPQGFPRDFALHNLARLISIIDTTKDQALPELEFGETEMTVHHAYGRVTFPYSNDSLVSPPPRDKFQLTHTTFSFELPQALWTKIKRLAPILDADGIHLITEPGAPVRLKLINSKDKYADKTASGSATFDMPNTKMGDDVTSDVWKISFSTLDILPGDYRVEAGSIARGGDVSSRNMNGVFFTLNSPVKVITYLTIGEVVKMR
jgi:hypothetical protein